MNRRHLALEVKADGLVEAVRWSNAATCQARRFPDPLDGELVRAFEGWLGERERTWSEDEIRAFGTLLHRWLFPPEVWAWVQRQLDGREGHTIGISLRFPAGASGSELAAVPWEYLYVPDRPGVHGYYLAQHPDVVLTRYVPTGAPRPEPLTTALVLPVVSSPDPDRLGEVDSEDVESAIRRSAATIGFSVADTVVTPTAAQLEAAVLEQKPTLLHFMGHGRFDRVSGQGEIALAADGGGTDWIGAVHLGEILGRPGSTPRVVVLHACDGGRGDFRFRFAGLGPELLRRGVSCVVGMQYPVTNETAIEFSTSLYDELGRGAPVDVAVQAGRQRLTEQMRRSPQLRGVPMVYLSDIEPVLIGQPVAEGTE